MHKLIVTLRQVDRGEEATIETVEPIAEEDLVFVVGPRAAVSVDDPSWYVRTVFQKLSAGR